MTFTPTHVLISRTKETPVQLVAGPQGYWLYTEAEAQKGTTPAFEVRPKLGFYCRGHQVVGFSLQPLEARATAHSEATQLAK
ncbi:MULTISPECIES: hypothetical protein [Cyanophyceae]|uniref:hypothetical protein n=1 Tax=Cyanophyceae TaxID=3028117 RepID=UPI0016843B30|nr:MULTISPECIES: hypothetical protein [Cyanophyceae]MBD1918833.1 hypothetical protein [Phormidium sp. FACHB-77]MBD2033324.1 hypothetical protein [Phormidium sp. FACHB-322]MBD2053743.1 hypothetical protein [Leptolyngbya sp. FACHB-60]